MPVYDEVGIPPGGNSSGKGGGSGGGGGGDVRIGFEGFGPDFGPPGSMPSMPPNPNHYSDLGFPSSGVGSYGSKIIIFLICSTFAIIISFHNLSVHFQEPLYCCLFSWSFIFVIFLKK